MAKSAPGLISIILVQIDEAHSTKWPVGLENTPTPQASFNDRVNRGKAFFANVPKSIICTIDGWDNKFANGFRAWPDVYYLTDSTHTVITKSTYGESRDARIDIDCIDVIKTIMTTEGVDS